MSIKITVGTQVISFPSSGADPNWSEGVIQFAKAVALQLQSVASAFDIAPSVQVLTNDANVNLNINDAIFPSGSVRSFNFTYAIYRTNGTIALSEDGTVSGVFDTLSSTWFLNHTFDGERQSDGSPYHTFTMSGDQLQLTTVAIGGAYSTTDSRLSYAAKTILTSDL